MEEIAAQGLSARPRCGFNSICPPARPAASRQPKASFRFRACIGTLNLFPTALASWSALPTGREHFSGVSCNGRIAAAPPMPKDGEPFSCSIALRSFAPHSALRTPHSSGSWKGGCFLYHWVLNVECSQVYSKTSTVRECARAHPEGHASLPYNQRSAWRWVHLDTVLVWSSAFRRFGRNPAICRVNAELQTRANPSLRTVSRCTSLR